MIAHLVVITAVVLAPVFTHYCVTMEIWVDLSDRKEKPYENIFSFDLKMSQSIQSTYGIVCTIDSVHSFTATAPQGLNCYP